MSGFVAGFTVRVRLVPGFVLGACPVRIWFVSVSCLLRAWVRVWFVYGFVFDFLFDSVRISRKLAGLDVNVIMFMLFFFRSRF